MPDAQLPGPSWWHDPSGRHQYRYWDGTAWTEHVADNGVGAVDPVDGAEPPVVPAVTVPEQPAPRPVAQTTRQLIQPLTLEELAARRVIGAPDPDPTEFMPRRVIAFLIDAAVCFAAAVLLITAIAPSYSDTDLEYQYTCDSSPNGFVDTTSCRNPTFVEIGDHNYDISSDGVALLAAFAVFTFGYWAVAETALGTTLGKGVLGLRVVDLQGRRVHLGQAAIRWLLLLLDGPLTAFLCGLMLSSSTNGHQRLGDRWSDSYVVHRSFGGKPLTLPE